MVVTAVELAVQLAFLVDVVVKQLLVVKGEFAEKDAAAPAMVAMNVDADVEAVDLLLIELIDSIVAGLDYLIIPTRLVCHPLFS